MKALGIDLGTTKVAAVIYDKNTGLEAVASQPHNAAENNSDPTIFEQDVSKITHCVDQLISLLPEKSLAEISAIGVTGQMHSLLLKNGKNVSPLVTWQDRRCGQALLDVFNRQSKLDLHEGFGGTTLARLAQSGELTSSMQAATISDFLTMQLSGNQQVITDPTHAASWGIYDLERKEWNYSAIESLNIPAAVLPEIRPGGSVIGTVTAEYSGKYNLPGNTKIVNAIGDNQASIIGTGNDFEHEIYLTLGTGAQLSMVCDDIPEKLPVNIELRPFPGNRQLMVSAPLCGGAAFAVLADTINNFRAALGEEKLERGKLLDKLDACGMEYIQKHGEPDITVNPHFLGERYAPDLRGSIHGLTLDNAIPGALAAALALGIVRNLKKDFPPEVMQSRQVVIGSGNAVRLIKSIQYAIEKEFSLPLVLSQGREEAAVGAARQAIAALR